MDRDPKLLIPIAAIMLLRGNRKQQEEALRYLASNPAQKYP
jgi:hypothetical protein